MERQRARGDSPEECAEALLRGHPLIVPGITVLVAASLYAGLGPCLRWFEAGSWSIVLVSGLAMLVRPDFRHYSPTPD